MPRPRTTVDRLALWAALPMAHTSRIEGRLMKILDTARSRRAVTRRFLLAALGFGLAALVPLAMLRPVARAQTAPAVIGAVQLVGVRDIDIHHTDHRWWRPSGLLSPGIAPDIATPSNLKGLFGSSNEKNLCFALRLPATVAGQTVAILLTGSLVYASSAASWAGESSPQKPQKAAMRHEDKGAGWMVYASFPASAKQTTLSVGIAVKPWAVAATHVLNRDTASTVTNSRGSFLFGPVTRPTKSLWGVTVTVSHPKQDWRVVGVNRQGHVILPSYSGSSSTNRLLHLTPYFPQSVPITQIQELRVETRPYQWTEFKDVALQPVK